MGETKSEKANGTLTADEKQNNKKKKSSVKKKSKFADLKAEFKKIIWPDKETLTKQTTAVVAISVVLGVIISALDFLIQYGVDFLVK